MVLTLIQQGLCLRPREKRALCGKMSIPNFLFAFVESLDNINILLKVICIFVCGRFLFVTSISLQLISEKVTSHILYYNSDCSD